MREHTPPNGSLRSTTDPANASRSAEEGDAGETPVTVLWTDDRSEVTLNDTQVIDAVIWGTTDHEEFTVSKTYDVVVGTSMEPARLQTVTERTNGDYRLRFARE
ncbi:hypothetical protein [Halopelagius longus]|uniref:Uncharacterized protein n=1 Tax=Halopelagius longus TaxID=1236180 RepID=A0A1H1C3Z2_9EURY|nr:hypothetical protein [Halopelagius longus]RDI71058.1 hypothetical protein DWB78_04555 [Halopelagius longus]SDQ58938.1 hypothetical protein SAMN05216278_2102 [Halopelagius longus]